MNIFTSLTPVQRGIAYIIAGSLIMLDALNILSKTVHFVILITAIGLIVYGVILTNVMNLIKSKK